MFQQIMQMMNNPQLRSIMNCSNPQQAMIQMIKQSPNANTDMGKNVISMLERGDYKSLEEYGKNLAQSQGITPDQINMIRNTLNHR